MMLNTPLAFPTLALVAGGLGFSGLADTASSFAMIPVLVCLFPLGVLAGHRVPV